MLAMSFAVCRQNYVTPFRSRESSLVQVYFLSTRLCAIRYFLYGIPIVVKRPSQHRPSHCCRNDPAEPCRSRKTVVIFQTAQHVLLATAAARSPANDDRIASKSISEPMIVAACLTFHLHRSGFSVPLRLILRLFAVSAARLACSS